VTDWSGAGKPFSHSIFFVVFPATYGYPREASNLTVPVHCIANRCDACVHRIKLTAILVRLVTEERSSSASGEESFQILLVGKDMG